jgi:hypothetical protein
VIVGFAKIAAAKAILLLRDINEFLCELSGFIVSFR